MQIPTIPPRTLLAIRVASFTFGITSLGLSAASVQITRTVPRPATGDNILIIIASAFGLITTAYRIYAHRLKNERQRKQRFIPVVTESIVIGILLAGFIYGVITTTSRRGACGGVDGGDGDDGEAGERGTRSGKACSLTKASTSFTFMNFFTFIASTYTVGKAA